MSGGHNIGMEMNNSAVKVNVLGDNADLAETLGLSSASGRVNKWLTGANGTVLPTFYISTPKSDGSRFNSLLKGGNADPKEWQEWVGEFIFGAKRGHYAHGGLYNFLQQLMLPELEIENILLWVHERFLAEILKYETISDREFSKQAFFCYDEAFAIFTSLAPHLESYKAEKMAINGGRTKPRPRPNKPSKNMGGTLYSLRKDTIMPSFNAGRKVLELKTGVKSAESHIFAEEFLDQFYDNIHVIVTK